MEEIQERRYSCKHCGMSFTNGRILGGHVRSHMAKKLNKALQGDTKKEREIVVTDTVDDQCKYGLRENPKKSWKFCGSSETDSRGACSNSGLKAKCQTCWKVFESSRALYGHMKIHSRNGRKSLRACNDQARSVSGSGNFLLMGFLSSEESIMCPVKRKRSPRVLRCNIVRDSNYPSFLDLDQSLIPSSSLDIDSKVEDVAAFLIMMSKGMLNRDYCPNSINESSDNTSLCFEVRKVNAQSGGGYIRLEENLGGGDFVSEEAVCVEKGFDSNVGHSRNAGVDDSLKGNEDEARKCTKKEMIPPSQDHGTKATKISCSGWNIESCSSSISGVAGSLEIEETGKSKELEPRENCVQGEVYARKRKRCHELEERKCPVCDKIFVSGQALGGHKRAHYKKDIETNAGEVIAAEPGILDNSNIAVLDVNAELSFPCAAEEQNNEILVNSSVLSGLGD